MPVLKSGAKAPMSTKPTAPSRPAPAKDSFGARFAAAEAGKGGNFVPPDPGQYNALIVSCVAERESEGIKETAYIEYAIHDPGEPMHGRTHRIYFNFTKEDGTEGTGMPYFKGALEMLGMDSDIKSWEECEEVMAEIEKMEPWIIVDVKKKGAYTNSFIHSVPDDQKNKPTF